MISKKAHRDHTKKFQRLKSVQFLFSIEASWKESFLEIMQGHK